MKDEESFPRGGNKRKNTEKEPKHRVKNLFSLSKTDKQKSKKRKKSLKVENVQEEEVQLSTTTAEVLNTKTVQEGMLILAYVRNVTPYKVEVELPGRMFGKIPINSISQSYTKLLAETTNSEDEDNNVPSLINLVQPRQFVPTKLMQKNEANQKLELNLSLNPSDINSELNHSMLGKGFRIWAAISAELDHGYQLDAGVRNSRIFLPHKNVKEGLVLVIGQPMWCTVLKCDISGAAATVTVSILDEHLKNPVTNERLSLHSLVPGMPFNFHITKHLKNGLEGKILNEYSGYVNEVYFKKPYDTVSNYGKGGVLPSWLLYVQPTTKLAYFSLRNSELTRVLTYDIGKIVNANVIGRIGSGLNVKCPSNEICFVPYKHLALPKNDDARSAIANKYKKDHSYKCRVINYHQLDQLYIGSFEPGILSEKYFDVKDIKVGDRVEANVKMIVDDGLVVKFGLLEGFIHNKHLSNVAYSENIKKQFKIGQKLKAKVWKIEGRTINLTHKSSLVNSDLCLSSYDTSLVGQEFPGVVTKVRKNVVILAFYGGVIGVLFKDSLDAEGLSDAQNMFYVGEVIKTIVKTVAKDKVYLSLNSTQLQKKENVSVGKCVEGTVSKIAKDGLEIEVGATKLKAFLPVSHISNNSFLSSAVLETYKVGDVLKELLCIAHAGKPILSISEATFYKEHDFEIPIINKLEVGSILRCYYKSSGEDGILVSTLCNKSLAIRYFELCDTLEQKDFLKFEPYEMILVRIKKNNAKSKKCFVSAKLSTVFDGDFTNSLNFLEQNVLDFQKIQSHLVSIKSSLGNLELGQRVTCKVDKINEFGCSVSLENGVQGLVSINHCPKELKCDGEWLGVILWINYKHKFAEISLLEDVINSVNELQDGSMNKALGSTSNAEVLISNPEYTVAVLKDMSAKKQLIFLPTIVHQNAFLSRVEYDKRAEIKVIISKKVGSTLMGIDRAVRRLYKKQHQNNRKRKADKLAKFEAKKARLELDIKESDIKEEDEDTLGYENYDSQITDIDIKSEEEEEDNEKLLTNNSKSKHKKNESEKEEVTVGQENYDSQIVDVEIKSEEEEDNEKIKIINSNSKPKKTKSNKEKTQIEGTKETILPGVQSFFDDADEETNKMSTSGEDDDDEKSSNQTKKKKLSLEERRQLMRLKEEELLKKEAENADLTLEPQTVEQFEKIIKSNPNSSQIWAKYVAHLVFNGEIEKAKSVAQEALSTIALLTKERYNIWMVILNLENSYGDKNSFEETFEEAIKRNDDLSIYLDTINILYMAQKYDEMEDKIKKAKKKFKQHERMWTDIAQVYYKLRKFDCARSMRDGAMKSIDKSLYIGIIVKFAMMEFQFGEKEQGEALFENILHLHPKRVDIWCAYVDQCVKINNIEIARRLLNRAVLQNIPPKKMKVLYNKFKNFEKAHGDDESVQHVIELAENYVKSI